MCEIDLSKVTPAPWCVTGWDFSTDEHPQRPATFIVGDYDKKDRWDTWIAEMFQTDCLADAEFIALARNAFEGDPEALAWWEANRRKRT